MNIKARFMSTDVMQVEFDMAFLLAYHDLL